MGMRLPEFIRTNLEEILSGWVKFARSREPAGRQLDADELRNHAGAMLLGIAHDLEAPQSAREETARAQGAIDVVAPHAESAAAEHGAGRAEYGFTLQQMVSEFRALRAAVIRLWKPPGSQITEQDFDDLRCFDEAIDQTLTASVTRYIKEGDHAKETFLGILGHDLKTPLSAVTMSARFMLETGNLSETNRALVERIERSARRMNNMVRDLLDFTRSRLGSGMPITREDANLETVVREAVDEVTASNPNRPVDVELEGALEGRWDAGRITQALSNLIANAVHHGAPTGRVRVTARGETDSVNIAVHNEGQPIPTDRVRHLLDPLARVKPEVGETHDAHHLGLGLHIAKAIATAHGGHIEIESSAEQGTTFTLHLPRAA